MGRIGVAKDAPKWEAGQLIAFQSGLRVREAGAEKRRQRVERFNLSEVSCIFSICQKLIAFYDVCAFFNLSKGSPGFVFYIPSFHLFQASQD